MMHRIGLIVAAVAGIAAAGRADLSLKPGASTRTAEKSGESQNVWTVSAEGGFGKLVTLGLPANLQLQAFYNVQRPDYAPESSIRLQAQLLLPASLLK